MKSEICPYLMKWSTKEEICVTSSNLLPSSKPPDFERESTWTIGVLTAKNEPLALYYMQEVHEYACSRLVEEVWINRECVYIPVLVI